MVRPTEGMPQEAARFDKSPIVMEFVCYSRIIGQMVIEHNRLAQRLALHADPRHNRTMTNQEINDEVFAYRESDIALGEYFDPRNEHVPYFELFERNEPLFDVASADSVK